MKPVGIAKKRERDGAWVGREQMGAGEPTHTTVTPTVWVGGKVR